MTTTKKWFVSTNLSDLKKEYRKLAQENHPDHGGSETDMMQINAQYDELCERLPEINVNGEEYEPTSREIGSKFRSVINAIITLEGIHIEICGCWIWISGNTKPYREIFKKCGCIWRQKKQCWSWAEKVTKHYYKKNYSMNDIRNMYGSQEVPTEPTKKL